MPKQPAPLRPGAPYRKLVFINDSPRDGLLLPARGEAYQSKGLEIAAGSKFSGTSN